MASRAEYKKRDELAAYDLNAGCRSIVNQSTPGMRKLRDKLRRQARKRLNRRAKDEY